MSAIQKCKIRDKKAWPGQVTYFSIRGFLNISGTAKATNFQKLSMGMTGISGHSFHRGPGAEPMEGASYGSEGDFAPPPPRN